MTEKNDRPAETQATPLTDSQVSAFNGRSLHDYVYFESDFDGDLHAVGAATAEEASKWTVTLIHPDGTREPGTFYVAVIFHKEATRGRPVWYADRTPGTRLEFRLPDGTEFVVDASR